MKTKLVAAAVVLAVIVLGGVILAGCSTQMGAGTTAVKVDDYLVIPADPKVDGCIEPENSAFNPPGGFKAIEPLAALVVSVKVGGAATIGMCAFTASW